ncbi:MAG: ATP-binding protein [Gammaproteobacteria bacterium]|nr:ATP-binding protein [Gammaproteobacteria bacterium]
MSPQFKINPVTLIFDDPKLETEYTNQNYKSFLLQARIAFLIGATLYPIFGILDSWFVPEENLLTVWTWRLSFLGLGVAIFLLNYTKVFKHFYFLAMAIIGFIAATGLIVIYTYLPAETLAYYYPALILVVFWTYNFTGTRFIYALIIDIAVLVSYNLLAYKMEHPLSIILAHDIFLFSANIVAGSVGYLTEYNRRKLFFTNQLLQEERNSHQDARNDAESSNHAKSMFLANMSHEIRTPMNGVLGMIQVLRGTTLKEDQKHYLEILDSSSNHLLLLIDDLLDLSKIESGELVLDIDSFKTFSWITDIQNLVEPNFENKKTIFTTELSKNLPGYLEGDAARLLQVVVNLLNNAEKFTPNGEVKLEIGGELINENQFKLQVTVKDTGIGIADDKLEHVFEAFHQLETDRSINKGVGLGLAICKRLSDIMSGNLQVTSQLGKGSCFTFTTILSVPKENINLENTEQQFNIDHALSILLVDDNMINRFAARTLLEQAGHNIVEAENGKIAVEKTKLQSFDVILMDIYMPDMDGVSATRAIREGSTKAKHIPIIGLTASVMKYEKDLYLSAGMNAVVEKPIVINKLFKIIKSFL